MLTEPNLKFLEFSHRKIRQIDTPACFLEVLDQFAGAYKADAALLGELACNNEPSNEERMTLI